MTLGPGVRRFSVVIVWGGLIGMFIAAAFIWPHQAVGALITPVVLVVMAWIRLLPIRLDVTESVVRVRQGKRSGPTVEVPRSDISAIHFSPGAIGLWGPDPGTPILTLNPEWTLRQMLRVARELEVPLYDHRRWLGLRKDSEGRLVYDPSNPPGG